jgi:hypothetical protein
VADNCVLLPLDSRPVSVRLPVSLARLAGVRLATPPRGMLGGLHSPADFEALRSWIFDTLTSKSPVLFVSADLLCYGGLIFSRENRVSCDLALKKLDLLRHLKRKFPDLRIMATGVILRDSVSVRNDEDFALWQRLQSGRGPYPQWFTNLRQRNASVNRAVLELTADGTVDFALLGKEDTAPTNPFRREISDLRRVVREQKISSRAMVINGTDELTCLLISRYISEKIKKKPAFLIDSRGSDFPARTPLFESRELDKTLREQIRAAGGRVAQPGKPYDIRLFLHCPKEQQQDLFALQMGGLRTPPKPARDKKYYTAFAKAVAREKQMSAVADIAFANGADPSLTNELISRQLLFKLGAWAAWNTASNTTGTTISTAIASWIHSNNDIIIEDQRFLSEHASLILERIADDDIYQSRVRCKLVRECENPHSIENTIQINPILNKMMIDIWNSNIQKNIIDRSFDTCLSENINLVFSHAGIKSIKLPWSRLFECEVVPQAHFSVMKIDFTRADKPGIKRC